MNQGKNRIILAFSLFIKIMLKVNNIQTLKRIHVPDHLYR